MTENQIISRELLIFLSSYPRELKEKGHCHAGKLAVGVGNSLRVLSFHLEPKEPQIWQPLDEDPKSLYALAMQFREIGLQLWDQKPHEPWATKLQQDLEIIKTRLQNLEGKTMRGGK